MAGISDFLANLPGGGARANRFEIVVDFPPFAGGTDESRKTAFLAQSSSLPGSNMGTMIVAFRGRELKLPGDRTFESWDVTFYNDTGFELRNAFEKWHNEMNSYNSNSSSLSPSDYLSTVSVYQLDRNNQRVKEYTLKLAWPSVVAPIDVSQDSNDVIEMFSVTFEYSDIDNGNNS